MVIRVSEGVQASIENVRRAVGARSAAEVVRLLVQVAEGEIGKDEIEVRPHGESVLVRWPADVGVLARARQIR